MTRVENALNNVRLEYVEESTAGTPPTNPQWTVLSDYITDFTAEPGGSNNSVNVLGTGDIKNHFRGPEEPALTTSYYKQQAFVDSNDVPNYPAARPLTYSYQDCYPSYTVEFRRETTCGGNDDAGFREYVVIQGARPTEVSAPGDPSQGEPIIEELTWEPEKARAYVIHQPSTSTTVDVENKGSSSIDVTIEDESASTSETLTVSGGSTQSTTATFADIDVIWAESEPTGDILVTDGSGTTLLEKGLAGSDTTNVEGEKGIPPLGSGSHGSAIGTDPEKYLFAGVSTPTWQGSNLSDRIHALDLTVSLDVSREAKQGTRRQSIDIGTRTAEVDADVAGPFESAELIAEVFQNEEGDFVYVYPDNDVTLQNARIAETPDYTRSAEDANYIPSVTFQGAEKTDSAAITVTNTT